MDSCQYILNSIFPNIKTSDVFSLVQNDEIETYIIPIMGEPQVGKTSFCTRFAFDYFNLEIKESLNTESYKKTIEIFNKEITIVLIDVARNLEDKNMLQELCGFIDGAIIMYDITSNKSFNKVDFWINELLQLTKQQKEKKIPVFFVGNKADLQFLRAVDKENVLDKIDSLNYNLDDNDSNQGIYKYESKEVNGIDNNNIQDCMKDIIAQIFLMKLSEKEKAKYEKMYSEEIKL